MRTIDLPKPLPKIADIVPVNLMEILQESYLNYLQTSAAIYNRDGTYATSLITSQYCKCLADACEARAGKGKGICHEDCWRVSMKSIDLKAPYGEECSGGLIIYSVPIMLYGEPIGAANAAVSNPPRDIETLKKIAEEFEMGVEDVQKAAAEYQDRPKYVLTAAKRQIEIVAKTAAALYEVFYKLRLKEEKSLKFIRLITSLTAASNDNEALRIAVELLAVQTECNKCVLWLWNEEESCLIPRHSFGLSPDEQDRFSTSIVKPGYIPSFDKVLATKGPDFVEEPEKGDKIPLELVKTFNIGKAVHLPVLYRGKVIGIVAIEYKIGHYIYTKEILDQCDAILSTLGVVLEDISLTQELQKRVFQLTQQLEILESQRRIDTNILSASPLEDSLKEMENIVPFDTATIFLIDEEKKCVMHKASIRRTCFLEDISIEEPVIKNLLRTGSGCFRPDLLSERALTSCDREMLGRGVHATIHTPLKDGGKIIGWLMVGSRGAGRFGHEHLQLIETFADQLSIAWTRLKAQEELKEAFEGIIKSLSASIDAKSPWTQGHSERVAKYAAATAREMGLDDEFIKKIELAGLLHDIGKLGTYIEVLDKPGKLAPEEQQLVEQHPAKGEEILSPIKWFKDILPCIRHHHERWDGAGYPDKIKGEEIHIGARILAVADTYEAMTSKRPYRKALSQEEAQAELIRNKGTQFDPKVVDAFLKSLGS